MDSNKIRQDFLDFFRSKGHEIVPSSPVVPFDDPTLMFTNAGMNQFKDVFLATGSRPYNRAADTQKCIRAGGKHNDLDDVGQDTYHHTFFEMLGNWSFGDYFKKEAIEWAWELLTKVWAIDPTRLHATYFEGSAAEGVEADNEARDLWAQVAGMHSSHIHPGNKKDNFWEMGDTGPCGPCSEIHIDLTPDKSGGHLVNKGDHRVMEIWNLVFIQFNRGGDGKLTPLPAKHVDTGMGFERLCAVLSGTRQNKIGQVTNYDTDVFTPIFAAIQMRTNAPKYQGTLPSEPQSSDRADSRELMTSPSSGNPRGLKSAARPDQSTIMTDVSYRVIADHIRCLTFALTDGAIPSNEGRGYVLRRVLRRAVRYGRQYMNMHEPFLCDLVAPLVEHMSGAFPELRTAHRGKNVEHVTALIRDEEASFLKTLDRGIKLFADAAEKARSQHNGRITGEDAFKLHDTYGFPIDLTELMAEEQGLTIDVGEYERLMEEARERARNVVSGYGNLSGAGAELVARGEAKPDSIFKGVVDDSAKYADIPKCDAVIQWLGRRGEGSVIEYHKDEWLNFSAKKTCFYAEQGGQVSDEGTITTDTGEMRVVNVHKLAGGLVTHDARVIKGVITFGPCHMEVDMSRRLPTMQNHTATHVLNWALREVLEIEGGGKVDQKGSLVDPEKTRFDFSHNKPLTDDELDRIEKLCGEQIAAKLPVYAASREEDFQDQKQAREINTLRAVFGEKYPDRVRVVSIGVPITEEDAKCDRESARTEVRGSQTEMDWLLRDPKNPRWMKYSVEFCGGTHVKNTSEIEHFVLTSEEGVAKGIRRVVGISGKAARTAESLGTDLLHEAKAFSEPRSSDRADSRSSVTSQDAESPRGLKSAAQLADFQKRLSEAQIPLRLRRQIQAALLDVQKVMKEHAKESAAVSGDAALDAVKKLFESAQTIGGVTVVVGEVPPASPEALRGAIDWVRNKTESSAVLLGFASEGKVTLIAGMSKTAVERGLKAGDLIKEICPLVGGKGGGRPDMAQGGGADPSGLVNALDRGKSWITGKLS